MFKCTCAHGKLRFEEHMYSNVHAHFVLACIIATHKYLSRKTVNEIIRRVNRRTLNEIDLLVVMSFKKSNSFPFSFEKM